MAGRVNEDDVSSVLELFGGRFDSSEIEKLLLRHNNDKRELASYLIATDPSEIRRSLGNDADGWTLVKNLKKFKKNKPKVDRAKTGVIETSVREFSCIRCDSFWWRRVPLRKMVSTCNRCKSKYRAIPRNREWGIANYECTCGHKFRGWGQMELIHSPCFECGNPCLPLNIIPPSDLEGPRTKNQHQCLSPDCHNRYRGGAGGYGHLVGGNGYGPNVGGIRISCVHPKSRRINGLPMVVESSDDHHSTGSTVATFLDQSGLREMYNEAELVFSPPLPTVGEE